MSEENTGILDMDLGSIDTAMPIVKAGLYDLKVMECSVEPNKANDGDNLNIVLTNTQPAQSTKDETLNPENARIYHTISLKQTQKAMPEAIARRVAQFVQACTPAVSGVRMSNLKECTNMFVGKIVRCKVDHLKESTGKDGTTYPEKNSIATFVKM